MSCMSDNEQNNLKKGSLSVKLALNLGAIVGQYKFWSRKWVELRHESELEIVALDIKIFRSSKSDNIVFRKRFESRNTAIFRCQ